MWNRPIFLAIVACFLAWQPVRGLPQVEEPQYLTRLKAKLFDESLITLGSGESGPVQSRFYWTQVRHG